MDETKSEVEIMKLLAYLLPMPFFGFNFFLFLTIKEGGYPPRVGARIK